MTRDRVRRPVRWLASAFATAYRLTIDRTALTLLQPTALTSAGGDPGGFTHLSIAGRERLALRLTTFASVEWRVHAAAGARVQLQCGMLDDNASPVTVSLEMLAGDRRVAGETATPRPRRWTALRLRVPRTVGGYVVIRVTAAAQRGGTAAIALAEPEIVRRKPAALSIRAAFDAVRVVGLRGIGRHLLAGARQHEDNVRYAAWRVAHARSDDDLRRLRNEIVRAPIRPRISVITAVYNTEPLWLRACIESVRRQVYPEWEMCLADDGSTSPETLATLRSYEAVPGFRILYGARNRGIVHASNAALALASGEFVAFLDHDDEIEPDALAEVARAIAARPDVDVVYTDEDKVDSHGIRSQPHFKPDWSPELLRSCMYVSHLTVMRRAAVLEAGGFRAGYDGSQDYDLMLRVTERTDRIAHVPRVLYSWRRTPASAASSHLAKPWALSAGRRALEDSFRRRGVHADVRSSAAAGHYTVRHAIAGSPLVSILIAPGCPLCGAAASDLGRLARALWAIERTTRGQRIEFVIVHRDALDGGARRVLRRFPHQLVARPDPGETEPNVAALLNDAAALASGDYLLLLHDDVRPDRQGWVRALVEYAQQEAVGAVGPFLLRRNGTIDHAGFVIGAGGVAAHALQGESWWTGGPSSNTIDVRNCSAVSGACLLTRRAVFNRVGGLEVRVGRELYDVDYGLRVRRAGLRVVVTPHAWAYHETAADTLRGPSPAEAEALRAIWGNALDSDPYYNPNFNRATADFRLPPSPDADGRRPDDDASSPSGSRGPALALPYPSTEPQD